ncbi:hypothetical protein Glove_82g68 [Diversispora epigaea]|uniref:Protein kinase domain-containing protein n=1 Tax=Diversispora epigaea TaxID=1348612 RepID=A0A397J7R6_9GLOM|nr:hypothetical protein Glove_82g68 [Diversispora epigaea]
MVSRNNCHSLTWFQKYKIINHVTYSLNKIRKENVVHKDLHSGNILYNAKVFEWIILKRLNNSNSNNVKWFQETFLIDNCHSLTWFQKYKIINHVTYSLNKIRKENVVHKDLHSGNILYNAKVFEWYISDLGTS